MILIGKTANWLLGAYVIAHSAVLKAVDEFVRMREITRSVKVAVLSHARTVVRECCKGDDDSQWERGKFDPPPPKNPLTDGHQNWGL